MDRGRCREPSGTARPGAARLAAPTPSGARTRRQGFLLTWTNVHVEWECPTFPGAGGEPGAAMRSPHAFGHLDADCFYVSAERVRNRFLVGKPVAVLGNNGACVIARSYEMREAGIRTG